MKKNNFIDFFNTRNIIIIIIIIFIIFNIIYTYSTQFTKTITIKNLNFYKYGKYSTSQYLVTDENDNVYIVSNSIYYLFFNSPELYTSLQNNQKYIIKGFGLRIPILGFFPHIIKATKIN